MSGKLKKIAYLAASHPNLNRLLRDSIMIRNHSIIYMKSHSQPCTLVPGTKVTGTTTNQAPSGWMAPDSIYISYFSILFQRAG
ncbi:hypothetical protein [Falsibacillus albus]|uniref:Uncharacterized protein n=1 Tax=Falsibacillus albus TaxID=2478915 RepID=A0A3L7JRL9_9BACI|nr:hypothetical protein [Falsibacillus albus]RLQ93497.1 hypothetical protein D9X91_17505 [Falsibacillus albus]